MVLFPINFLISLGICSTPRLSKHVTFLTSTYKAIQWVPIDSDSTRFIIYGPSFIFGKVFPEQIPLNLDSF